MSYKIALISDFDGTISKYDFFWHAIDKLLTKKDIQPWEDYIDKKITHVQALTRIFAKIHTPKPEFDEFVLELPIDEYFVDTVEFCRRHNIDIFVLSAGADYYINKICEKLGVTQSLTVIGNPSTYSQEEGLKFLPVDKNLYYYSEEFGISKHNFVKAKMKEYDKIIFAGDGIPDLGAAELVETAFAKGTLLKLCKETNIPTMKFDSYNDILGYLKTLVGATNA